MLYSLIYVSELLDPTDQLTLDRIRDQSIELNQAACITGLLLHTPGHFCQLLQGSKLSVEQTLERILRDNRHKKPVVLLRTDFPNELFPDWSMATSGIPPGQTADTIARTHSDRLAHPEDIDEIVAVMQQYRFGNHPEHTPVVSTLLNDHSTSEPGASRDSENALDSLLSFGARVFASFDLLLLMNGTDTHELQIRASVPSIPECITDMLTQSNNQIDAWVTSNDNGSTAKVRQLPESISKLCSLLSYRDAVGHILDTGASNRPQTHAPGDNHSVAALWFLQKTDIQKGAVATQSTEAQKLFVSSFEHLLKQRRSVLESVMLQRKLQRQKLAIASSLERQDLVLRVASSAIVALDADCRVLMINHTARTLFSLEQADVPFRWPEELQFLDVNNQVPLKDDQHPIWRAVHSNSSNRLEQPDDWARIYDNSVVAFAPHASPRMVCLKCSAVAVSESDSAVSVVIVFDDITELERNRDRIRRSDRLEALGHLTGGIAHDFNNLLATVLNAAELSKRESKNAERQLLLNLAIDTVNRGAELTNRLVAFAVAQPMKPEVHKLSDILQAVEELAMASVSSDVKLVIHSAPESLAVLCDSGQLENALLNLLINSRDAIVSSGIGNEVHVTVKERERERESDSTGAFDSPDIIEICVTDNGPGMSSSDIQRATDPFFTTKESSGGSGLGLSMVYRFIQHSGGELLIDNVSSGNGLCVRMLIGQASTPPPTDQALPVIDNKKASQLSILLVEDDINLGTVLQKSLQHIGHRVRLLNNTEEALTLLNGTERFDLLLTDVVMPGSTLDGFSLAEQAIELRPDLKIIYMSGYVQPQTTASSALHGPILHKPVGINKLYESIQLAMASGEPLSV